MVFVFWIFFISCSNAIQFCSDFWILYYLWMKLLHSSRNWVLLQHLDHLDHYFVFQLCLHNQISFAPLPHHWNHLLDFYPLSHLGEYYKFPSFFYPLLILFSLLSSLQPIQDELSAQLNLPLEFPKYWI